MTKKASEKAIEQYNRMGEQIAMNRVRMKYVSRDVKRRLIRENHELMEKMDALLS